MLLLRSPFLCAVDVFLRDLPRISVRGRRGALGGAKTGVYLACCVSRRRNGVSFALSLGGKVLYHIA